MTMMMTLLVVVGVRPCSPGSRDVMAQFRGSHLGVGQGLGVEDGDMRGLFEVQACHVSPGNEDVIITGTPTLVSRDGIKRLLSFIMDDYREVIGLQFGLSSGEEDDDDHAKNHQRKLLLKPGYDLHVHFATAYTPIDSSCQMAAIFVCLVSLVVGRPSREDTVVVGDVTNEGYLKGCWRLETDLINYLRHCGIRRLIIAPGIGLGHERAAATTTAAVGSSSLIEEEGKPTIEVIEAKCVNDLLSLCFS